MANIVQIVARLPADLIERLDAHAEKLAREFGIHVSRNDVIKKLLQEGLSKSRSKK